MAQFADLLAPEPPARAAAVAEQASGLTRLIGNTPLLAIRLIWRGRERVIHAKAEHYNYTGSIKDRMALSILLRARASGALQAGDTIVEATSGNAGIAIAAIGRALGHRVKIFMPDWMSDERKTLLRAYGAELVLVSRKEGGFLGAIAQAEACAAQSSDVFLSRQFSNPDNWRAHSQTTGPEILCQLAGAGVRPDVVAAGVGTGGTVMGLHAALSHCHCEVRVHPIEPAESPTLSTGYKVGQHRIQGVSDDFIPDIVDLSVLDEVIGVSDGDAILMAQKLARTLGLGVGISSGANLIGALVAQDRVHPDAGTVTVFPDDNKKYLSTSLAGVEPEKDGYLTPEIELLDFDVIKSPESTGANALASTA